MGASPSRSRIQQALSLLPVQPAGVAFLPNVEVRSQVDAKRMSCAGKHTACTYKRDRWADLQQVHPRQAWVLQMSSRACPPPVSSLSPHCGGLPVHLGCRVAALIRAALRSTLSTQRRPCAPPTPLIMGDKRAQRPAPPRTHQQAPKRPTVWTRPRQHPTWPRHVARRCSRGSRLCPVSAL